MITVGEQTGALPQMLNSVAEFYEEDVSTALTAALALIEPAILIVMGVVVVFILISLYLPIFSLGQTAEAGVTIWLITLLAIPLPASRTSGPGRAAGAPLSRGICRSEELPNPARTAAHGARGADVPLQLRAH